MASKITKKKKDKNKQWLGQIDVLVEYCRKKKWELEFVKKEDYKNFQDVAWPHRNKLRIREDRKPEITFYMFLHEIGHMLVCAQKEKYNDKYKVFDKFNQESLTYKVSEVEEEFQAWERGLKLCETLDLKISRHKFEQNKASCIGSYLFWLLNRKINEVVKKEVNKKLKAKKKKRKSGQQRKTNKQKN